MLKVLTNEALKKQMLEIGLKHAQTMTDKIFAEKTMQIYSQVCR
jgi:hypothetical protein